jgi:hypothetical protein
VYSKWSRTRLSVTLFGLLCVCPQGSGRAAEAAEEAPTFFVNRSGEWLVKMEIVHEHAPVEVVRDHGWRADWRWDRLDLKVVRHDNIEARVRVEVRGDGGAELRCEVLEGTLDSSPYEAFVFVAIRSANGVIESIRIPERDPKSKVPLGVQMWLADRLLLFGLPSMVLVEREEPGSIALRVLDVPLEAWEDAPHGTIARSAIEWSPPPHLYPASIDAKGCVTFVGVNVMPKPRDWSFWRLVCDPRAGYATEVERVRYHLFQQVVDETVRAEAGALLTGDAVLISRYTCRATITPVNSEHEATERAEEKSSDGNGGEPGSRD